MDEDSFPIIFGGLMGLLAGIIGSLIAPWVHWGIEKRKTKRKERIQLLEELRSTVPTVKIQGKDFLASKNYIRIRPFLSSKLMDIIESPNIYHVSRDKNRIPKLNSEFLMELDAIEIEWRLGIGNGKNRKKKYYNPDWAGMHFCSLP